MHENLGLRKICCHDKVKHLREHLILHCGEMTLYVPCQKPVRKQTELSPQQFFVVGRQSIISCRKLPPDYCVDRVAEKFMGVSIRERRQIRCGAKIGQQQETMVEIAD